MNDSIEIIKNRIRNKRSFVINNSVYESDKIKDENSTNKRTKYLKNLLTRTLIAAIFILASIIFVKYSTENLLLYKKYILNDTWKFNKVNEIYQKYLGSVLPFDNLIKDTTQTVFNEKLAYKVKENHYEGVVLEVDNSYMVPAVKSGIIVFIGEKDNFNNTIIVQGVDGVDIWYGNIDSTNLKLYDYIETGSLIGEVKENKLYLVFQKEGNILSYEEYME